FCIHLLSICFVFSVFFFFLFCMFFFFFFFFSSRRRHTRWPRDWSSDVCSSDLVRAKVSRAPNLLLVRVDLLAIFDSPPFDYSPAGAVAQDHPALRQHEPSCECNESSLERPDRP